MKIKSAILTLSLSLVFTTSIFSQFQVGASLGAKYGNLQEKSALPFFNSSLAPSLEIGVRKTSNSNFYFTGSLAVENMGWIALDNTEIYDEASLTFYVKGTGISLSAGVGYHVINTDKFKIGLSTSIKKGYVLKNQFNWQFEFTHDDHIDILFSGPPAGYLSVDFKTDLILKLSEKTDLIVTPNYSQFFSRFYKENIYRNWGLQAGLLYTIQPKETIF